MEARSIKSTLLVLLLILAPLPVAVSYGKVQETSVAVPSYGTISYQSPGIDMRLNRYLIMESIDSNNDVVAYFDMCQTHYSNGQKVQAIHQLRPDFTALLYRNLHAVGAWEDIYNTYVNNGWLLKDAGGNIVYMLYYGTGYQFVDIGNPSYQTYIANWIKNLINQYGFDGVFGDCGIAPTAGSAFYGASANPINPRTGTYWTDREVRDAFVSLHTTIKNVIGSKTIIINGIWAPRHFYYPELHSAWLDVISRSPMDGLMSEGQWYEVSGSWLPEADWKASLDFTIWWQDTFPNKKLVSCAWVEDANGNDFPLPSGATKEQIMKYAVCSALLGMKSNNIYLGMSKADEMSSFGQALFDEANSLGNPIGDYYKTSGVYVRNYARGRVYVNPTQNPLTVDGITINSYSGTILRIG